MKHFPHECHRRIMHCMQETVDSKAEKKLHEGCLQSHSLQILLNPTKVCKLDIHFGFDMSPPKKKSRSPSCVNFRRQSRSCFVCWLVGRLSVGLELGRGLLLSTYDSSLRVVRTHAIIILILHGRDGSPAMVPSEV